MAFQFLGSLAALRSLKYQVKEFHDVLVGLKKYDMLKIADAIEICLRENQISMHEIKNIFKLMYPNIDKINRGAFNISDDINLRKMGRDKKYHVALSFAGEDRAIAEKIAKELTDSNYDVFYDDYERAELWGKDLYVHLNDLYSKRSKYCLMIISEHYANKLWTNHERRAAQSKAFKQNEEYILPLRLDDTEIPGINDTIGYIEYHTIEFEELIGLIKQKINS